MKVLLMGKSGSGKTSMRSVIFANYLPIHTRRLHPTINVERTNLRFFGNLILSVWDCAGDELTMAGYFLEEKHIIFASVDVLVFVVDTGSKDLESEIKCYIKCTKAALENCPSAKVFLLLHKVDLLHANERELKFREVEEYLKKVDAPLDYHTTSIWDETIYQAWSNIIQNIVPNVEEHLNEFSNISDLDEVMLLQKSTFLVIGHYERRHNRDRLGKVSKIIQRFKLSRSYLTPEFQSMEVRNQDFTCFIEKFTLSTYIVLVFSEPGITSALIQMNIKVARKYFQTLEKIT